MIRRPRTPRRFAASASIALAALTLATFLHGCGGGNAATVLFVGTCLEPLYKCFTTTGTGTCSYTRSIRQAKLLFSNGAFVTSISDGAADNQAFGPQGPPICLSVTRGTDGTTFTVRGKNPTTNEQINGTVIDDATGMLQVMCDGQAPKSIPKPAQNPSFEDLRRCVSQ